MSLCAGIEVSRSPSWGTDEGRCEAPDGFASAELVRYGDRNLQLGLSPEGADQNFRDAGVNSTVSIVVPSTTSIPPVHTESVAQRLIGCCVLVVIAPSVGQWGHLKVQTPNVCEAFRLFCRPRIGQRPYSSGNLYILDCGPTVEHCLTILHYDTIKALPYKCAPRSMSVSTLGLFRPSWQPLLFALTIAPSLGCIS